MLAIYVGGFSVFNNPPGPIAVAFSLFPLPAHWIDDAFARLA